MKVTVLYFGVLRDLSGKATEDLTLVRGARVEDIVHILTQRKSNLGVALKSIAIAVNREYASLGTELHEGDEIALLPPVSGGCLAS